MWFPGSGDGDICRPVPALTGSADRTTIDLAEAATLGVQLGTQHACGQLEPRRHHATRPTSKAPNAASRPVLTVPPLLFRPFDSGQASHHLLASDLRLSSCCA